MEVFMKVRRLQIEEFELARISIQTQMARLSIHAPIRRIKTISNEKPEMTVRRESPSIEVDMESLHNNIGLKSPMSLMREYTAQTKSQSTQAIKDIENNGDALAALPQNGNPVATIARNTLLQPVPPLKGSGTPSDPTVSVKGHQGALNIDWSIQDVSISWDDYQSPVITLDPKPSVDVTLAQPGQLKFIVVEQSFPPEKGRSLDKEV